MIIFIVAVVLLLVLRIGVGLHRLGFETYPRLGTFSRGHDVMMLAIRVGVVLWALFLLNGCAAPREVVRVEPVEVLVPVPVPPPAPPVVERPALPIEVLAPVATPADVARAYVATVIVLIGYADALEALLDAYRPPSGEGW